MEIRVRGRLRPKEQTHGWTSNTDGHKHRGNNKVQDSHGPINTCGVYIHEHSAVHDRRGTPTLKSTQMSRSCGGLSDFFSVMM